MTGFQFKLRDVLWLTTVVALVLGWWMDHRYLYEEMRKCHAQSAVTSEKLMSTQLRLREAEDLLEFEGVVFGDGTTIHTTPERAAQLRVQRKKGGKWPP